MFAKRISFESYFHVLWKIRLKSFKNILAQIRKFIFSHETFNNNSSCHVLQCKSESFTNSTIYQTIDAGVKNYEKIIDVSNTIPV